MFLDLTPVMRLDMQADNLEFILREWIIRTRVSVCRESSHFDPGVRT